jgi:hypothetical protein
MAKKFYNWFFDAIGRLRCQEPLKQDYVLTTNLMPFAAKTHFRSYGYYNFVS